MDNELRRRRWIVRGRLEGWTVSRIAGTLKASEKKTQGTQYHPARGDLSAFTEFCSGNGIEHIMASIRRPSTIGKIEAFHKAYDAEAWMFKTHQEFIHYWNYERPHQGIGYLYPADTYFRDLKKGTDVGS